MLYYLLKFLLLLPLAWSEKEEVYEKLAEGEYSMPWCWDEVISSGRIYPGHLNMRSSSEASKKMWCFTIILLNVRTYRIAFSEVLGLVCTNDSIIRALMSLDMEIRICDLYRMWILRSNKSSIVQLLLLIFKSENVKCHFTLNNSTFVSSDAPELVINLYAFEYFLMEILSLSAISICMSIPDAYKLTFYVSEVPLNYRCQCGGTLRRDIWRLFYLRHSIN